jgi:hypothetical protein
MVEIYFKDDENMAVKNFTIVLMQEIKKTIISMLLIMFEKVLHMSIVLFDERIAIIVIMVTI